MATSSCIHRLEIRVEPSNRALQQITLVSRTLELVTLIRINNELRLHTNVLKSPPELEGLRRRTLSVTLAHDDQRRCPSVGDEVKRRALRVDSLVLVCSLAEEWNHPLADSILAGVAEPVRDSGTGNGSAKTIRLRDGPHRHESTVAPTLDAESIAVDRIAPNDGVDAGHDVAQIAVSEILDVRAGEGLPLSVAPPGVGQQHEVTGLRQCDLLSR